mmetsp:Transcript_18496/g.46859  ORF Transcript_18496/g.46859 Transcript_18496/m.46859 type:complete len:647 (-) Transcript_18496:1115-3055(-)|eukprot:CAMPEP_0202875374 /NCGR_PEP_ID=MMETSP1391-20130828/27180_1 /ASSEMBLY_ACC=CAM_ASM_000867 /TAXON_ID=1034604 /ORGANISM="Chlamydomonas leiostraca, Strain SAG 11-49" /LENGTH=646 /DNA_ID=CAMNT_0049557041 /DNA_START=222 /DNA_END=2162 /DNA_ORIENTATION=-
MDPTGLPFPDDNLFADVLGGPDDWLGPVVNASDLTDFPDDFITQSLAAFSGRDDDEDDLQALMPERNSTRSPGMRGSFSMNDLSMLQQHTTMPPAWNHKLVSVKPKLESVPEGVPSNGGPLNLMPLSSNGMQGARPGQMHMPLQLPPLSSSKPGYGNSSDYVDLDSGNKGGMHGSLPSAGTLANQLQMTHVKSETHLSGMDCGPVAGSTAAAVDAFRKSGNMAPPPMGAMGHAAAPAGAYGLPHDQQGYANMDEGQEGQEDPSEQEQQPGQRRAPSGLPLRKSQSAVELGSWRSFSAGEEFWDLQLPGVGGKPPVPGKLSVEERLAKIQRYRDKRMQRNFNRSVKYQCRKSLADTRPRVRGRFARNDDGTPAEGKKGQQKSGSGDSAEQNTFGSSGQTSSGGGGAQDNMMQGGQCATSQPHPQQHMQHVPMGHHIQGHHHHHHQQHMQQRQQQQQQQAMMMAPQPPPPLAPQPPMQAGLHIMRPPNGIGINMIGASTMSSSMPANPYGMMPSNHGMMPSSWAPNMIPTSTYPSSAGPSVGGIFSGASRAAITGTSPDMSTAAGPSMMTYSHMAQQQLMPPSTGMHYLGGQTIFSGAMLSASAGVPGSVSGSAQPSLSPPPKAASPTPTSTSEAQSESHSIGHGLSL